MVDAAWLFGKEEHVDAQVVIVEEGASGDGGQAAASGSTARARTRKRGRAEGSSSEGQVVLPIHKLIVMSASEVLKARLSTWEQGNNNNEPCRVVLHVPSGQLELGRRLVRAMYEAAPDFDDLGLEQQLQLLRLADRYGAPMVVEAVAAAIGDVGVISDEGLAWAALRAIYPSAVSPPPVPALQPYAAAALQLLFGDLEAVWASADSGEKRRGLLSLPFEALKALLADERTRVASENVIMHTINRWIAKNKFASSSAQAKELLVLVRVANLTLHYARTVFCESKLAREHLSAGERALASMVALIDDDVEGFEDCEHWCLPARPRSALADAVVLEWCPRLAKLEALVTAMLTKGKNGIGMRGPKGIVWQGWPLHLQLSCKRSAAGGLALGLYLTVQLPCRTAGALIERSFEAVAASGGSDITDGPDPCPYTQGAVSWGCTDLFDLDETGDDGGDAAAPKDWAGLEAALRAKRVVHGEGAEAHLKLRCEVTRLE